MKPTYFCYIYCLFLVALFVAVAVNFGMTFSQNAFVGVKYFVDFEKMYCNNRYTFEECKKNVQENKSKLEAKCFTQNWRYVDCYNKHNDTSSANNRPYESCSKEEEAIQDCVNKTLSK